MSYDVAVFAIETRSQGSTTSYRVRWRVTAKRFTRTFAKKGLAESFRSELIVATRKGEDFGEETGLPGSMDRARSDVTFWDLAAEFTSAAWPSVSAKSRVSLIETLSRVVPAVVRDVPGAPDPGVLRIALQHSLMQGPAAPELDPGELAAMGWLRKASRPVTALTDASVVADVLDALAVNLDSKPASPAYFSRRRRVLHRAMGYAVRKKHLDVNPLASLPDGWTAPAKPAEALDPRSIGGPELVEHMLDVCGTIGATQGPRFRAFYGCMYHGLMRPSEVAALTVAACELPSEGWGWLTISDATVSAGRFFTDDGLVHEHRGLKGRTRGSPSTRARKPSRRVPIPPELVAMLREHVAEWGTSPEGRIFRSRQGNPIIPSTWWQVWKKVRKASLTDEQLAGPLMARPYDLRHAGVTRRLNEGMPQASVAAWAGHSVEVLTRIYTHVITGQEEALIAMMDAQRRRS
jgi:integrase